MISLSSKEVSTEEQKEISFSLKEEGKDILSRELNAQRKYKRRRWWRGGARALHTETGLTLRLMAPADCAVADGVRGDGRTSAGPRLHVIPLVPGQ